MSATPSRPADADEEARWLARAVQLAQDNVEHGGGPFGAVVVRPGPAGGVVLGEGVNSVTRDSDPTAHAEVVAIRAACRATGDFRLEGALLVASCEPCPMCLATALWARVAGVVFGADRHDAARAGFDDDTFHDLFAQPRDQWPMPVSQLPGKDDEAPFRRWRQHAERVAY
jgi:tRNA(Arg) A34 adenosine deaminase TadA